MYSFKSLLVFLLHQRLIICSFLEYFILFMLLFMPIFFNQFYKNLLIKEEVFSNAILLQDKMKSREADLIVLIRLFVNHQ